MRISFIGGGVMGEAMVRGLLNKGVTQPKAIAVADVLPARLSYLAERYSVVTTPSSHQAVKDAQVVVLAIKPQNLGEAMAELRGSLHRGQLALSIVAGATIATLRKGLDHAAIVRVMPNTPAQIGEGISVWTATPEVEEEQRREAQAILAALGKEIWVPEERYLDMATALSGSGPAYVALFIEALIDAGVHIGMSREMAMASVLQTVIGSAHFLEQSGHHPAEMRNMVTSPGGTTAEGLLKLEEGGFRALVTRAVIAAYEKSQKLGRAQSAP